MEDKERKAIDELDHKKKSHPKERGNFISNIFFWWALPIFAKGFKKDLTENDLYGPLKCHTSKLLGDKLEAAWELEVTKTKPSLWRALFRVFGKELAAYGLFFVVNEMFGKIAQPLFIGKLMDYYTPGQTVISLNDAYIYAGLIVCSSFVNALGVHSYVFGLMHLGMKMRIACCSLIYRKALKLSKGALAETTVGQMVNLLSNDVNRMESVCTHLHHIWLGPLEALVILYLLYVNVGPTGCVGIGLLLLFIPFQMYLGKKSSAYRMSTALKTDIRVRLMNEIISGIQVIKMYTWEKPFANLVAMSRKREIHEIRLANYMRALNFSFMMFLNRISVFLCVLVFILTGNQLHAQYAYTVIAFYNILRQVLTMYLPQGVTCLAESMVSVKRMTNFLNAAEIDDLNTSKSFSKSSTESQKHSNGMERSISNGVSANTNASKELVQAGGITLEDVSTKWISSEQESTLKRVNLHVTEKQTVAVVGTVGAGKTTLLHVILGELPTLTGNLRVGGTISYASQEPWLFAGSVRQNILFGETYESKKYRQVKKVCALERDFALLPYGDRTIVGDRGVTLSGGQRARINLARAIYKDADIYLLDDPLSAVDTHVGKQMFDNCIAGYLKEKCVVLVTHQLQYLRNVDRIFLLDNGRVAAAGNFAELQNSKSQFLEILQRADLEHHPDDNPAAMKRVKSVADQEILDLPVEEKEHQNVGDISNKVYASFFRAGGGWAKSLIVMAFFLLAQLGVSGSDYFITFWVNLEQERDFEKVIENSTAINGSDFVAIFNFNNEFFTEVNCIYIYTVLMLLIVIVTIVRSVKLFNFCVDASKNLHNSMFNKIVHATMRFYNVNPAGRILNRFAKDMGSIDELLPQAAIDTIQILLLSFAITVVVAIVNIWFIIPTLFIFALFYLYRIIYLSTSRDLKRMEGITRSPVFSHISASIQGLTTIRAFRAQHILEVEFDNHQDTHSSAFYMFMGVSRAFGFWLDMNCVIYIAIVTLSFLLMGSESLGGNVGLAITQSITLTGMLQWGMRQWSELENQMTSVERVVEYTELPTEPDEPEKLPESEWPQEGAVEFRNVSMRYTPEDDYVLKNLWFRVLAKEKVGIVGRTGAGKSSLITTIFRLVTYDGDVLIDGVNTNHISLNSLRSKLSIIPQEPVLFTGTLRKNLDPFDEYDDEELWSALEDVELKTPISEMSAGLQSLVSESGSNFSVGQRQLLCLARAAIRRNKILVLDEATANVDPQTDELIQKTIRKKFGDCTVLTIAHRLHTVMDSDKILVMDAGRVAQFDHPHVLLQDSEGIFYSLVKQTGRGMAENLRSIAEKAYQKVVVPTS